VRNNYVSRALYLNLRTAENNFEQKQTILKNCYAEQFSKILIAIHTNFLQFGPSVPSFVFAVLFKLFRQCFKRLFLSFAQFGGQVL